jgi:hypothetical protein
LAWRTVQMAGALSAVRMTVPSGFGMRKVGLSSDPSKDIGDWSIAWRTVRTATGSQAVWVMTKAYGYGTRRAEPSCDAFKGCVAEGSLAWHTAQTVGGSSAAGLSARCVYGTRKVERNCDVFGYHIGAGSLAWCTLPTVGGLSAPWTTAPCGSGTRKAGPSCDACEDTRAVSVA